MGLPTFESFLLRPSRILIFWPYTQYPLPLPDLMNSDQLSIKCEQTHLNVANLGLSCLQIAGELHSNIIIPGCKSHPKYSQLANFHHGHLYNCTDYLKIDSFPHNFTTSCKLPNKTMQANQKKGPPKSPASWKSKIRDREPIRRMLATEQSITAAILGPKRSVLNAWRIIPVSAMGTHNLHF